MTPATPARADPPPVTVWPPARRAVVALAVLTALPVVVVGALVGGAAADPWVRVATVAHLVAAAWAVTDARAIAVQVAAGIAACWALLVGADGTVAAVVVLVAGVVVTAELLGASHRLGMVVGRDPAPGGGVAVRGYGGHMTTTESPADTTVALRPGRDETDRLAARVAAPAEGHESLTVTSPLNGAVVGEVPVGTADDVAAAVARARTAQAAWAATPVRDRAAVLLRYHDLVLDHQGELLDLIQAENGKARVWAFEEIMDQAVTARYYARLAPRALKPQRRLSALPGLVSTKEHYVPKGVVGVISPWNYPLVLAVSDALAALVAGNAIAIKPDSQTPFTALRAFELLEEAGLPADLVQVVTGPGRTVGTAIIDAADYMMFTGSTATGRSVARQAGERLIGMSAELGGKNAMVVTDAVDLERAVEGAVVGSFANTGQLCISIERLYVDAAVADEFTRAFGDRTASLQLGAEQAYGPQVGALASHDQLDKVREHVDDAVAKGARVVAGGRHRPDIGELFYEPTVLTDVTPDMALYREETFGPVVAVYPVASDDEAVEQVNDTEYGLNASVYCDDTGRARSIARRLRAGTVNVNDGYSSAWASLDAPMGGMKASGLGRRHGREGLLKYTESQTIAVRSPLAAKLQDPGGDGAGYARRFTTILRKAKHLPR